MESRFTKRCTACNGTGSGVGGYECLHCVGRGTVEVQETVPATGQLPQPEATPAEETLRRIEAECERFSGEGVRPVLRNFACHVLDIIREWRE